MPFFRSIINSGQSGNAEPFCISNSSVAGKDVMIITPDALGEIRVGIGMRHWEIAAALAAKGFGVTLATSRPTESEIKGEGFLLKQLPKRPAGIVGLISKFSVLLVHPEVLYRYKAVNRFPGKIIVDLVCPFQLENLSLGQKQFNNSLRVVETSIRRGDFFICGNESQRLYWLGMLTALGRISKSQHDVDAEFRKLIDIVGFGIPPDGPVKTRQVLKGVIAGIEEDDFVLIWFGGIWNWLNPLPLVEAVVLANRKNPRVKLLFSMYRKPGERPHDLAVRTRKLSEKLGAIDKCIFFRENPIPFDERGDYLLESDLGVVIQAMNLETRLSARTRTLDYIWADLPILINSGDEVSQLVRQHDIGIVTETSGSEELATAILQYAGDSERQQRTKQNIRGIKDGLLWSEVVKPIEKYCREFATKANQG